VNVLFVDPKVIGYLLDSLGEGSDLYFGGAGVFLVESVLLSDSGLGFTIYHSVCMTLLSVATIS